MEIELTTVQDMHISDAYVEIIGHVKDDLTIKALTSIGLGQTLGQLSRTKLSVNLTKSRYESCSSGR
jgi:hypothetical protein